MPYLGKLLGLIVGLRFGALGISLGLALGHLLDLFLLRKQRTAADSKLASTVFHLMGYIAQADGQVSRQEVALGEQVFDQFGLQDEARRVAVAQFNLGRAKNFNPQVVLTEFVQHYGLRSHHAEQVLVALIAIASADGEIKLAERAALKTIAVTLGYREDEFVRQLERFASTAPPASQSEQSALEVLGLDASADADQIKRAYRKLISQYHPDKLEGAGVRGDALKGAQAKAKAVRAAYEQLIASRK